MPTIVLALTLLLAQIVPAMAARPARYHWVACLDTTMSVPPLEFAEYPAILASWMLARLRPGDTVTVLRLDKRDGGPQTFTIDTRPSRFVEGVRAIDAHVRSLVQVRDPRLGTDLGAPLEFVRKQIHADSSLPGTPVTAYRLVVLSDGIPDGKQSLSAWSASTADARVAFIGTHATTGERLRKLARQGGFTADADVQIIEFGTHHVAPRGVDGFLGRFTDPSILKALTRPQLHEPKKGT